MEQNLRKVEARIGNLDWIRIPKNWKTCIGINANKNETNSGLANRDYSVKCNCGSEQLMVVEGFWLWWCYVHNQPSLFCEREILKKQLENSKKKLEAIRILADKGVV